MSAATVPEHLRPLLDDTVEKNASDLHLNVEIEPTIRVDGKLVKMAGEEKLTATKVKDLTLGLLSETQTKRLDAGYEVDFSFSYRDQRFRTNMYFERGNLTASFRMIPTKIRSIAELGLPPILERFAAPSQGFVIITGPTGHGKSTTLAALVEKINQEREKHIITIEDPIEYVFAHNKSIISQREVGSDTHSFPHALRSALREDPDVVLVGEMRDLETIEAALTMAETGHLVFTTLHTNSAAQTADRIIDVFPPHQQVQVRQQLANIMLGVVSQRLIPRVSGGRIPVVEIMIANNAVKNIIREGKTHQLPNIIQTSAAEGMISLDKVLAELVSKGEITIDDALVWANDPKALKTLIY